jgi:hypothetical protein
MSIAPQPSTLPRAPLPLCTCFAGNGNAYCWEINNHTTINSLPGNVPHCEPSSCCAVSSGAPDNSDKYPVEVSTDRPWSLNRRFRHSRHRTCGVFVITCQLILQRPDCRELKLCNLTSLQWHHSFISHWDGSYPLTPVSACGARQSSVSHYDSSRRVLPLWEWVSLYDLSFQIEDSPQTFIARCTQN